MCLDTKSVHSMNIILLSERVILNPNSTYGFSNMIFSKCVPHRIECSGGGKCKTDTIHTIQLYPTRKFCKFHQEDHKNKQTNSENGATSSLEITGATVQICSRQATHCARGQYKINYREQQLAVKMRPW